MVNHLLTSRSLCRLKTPLREGNRITQKELVSRVLKLFEKIRNFFDKGFTPVYTIFHVHSPRTRRNNPLVITYCTLYI